MKGIIMAGGEGTRLRPLTCDCPKPMIRLMNRPVLDYALQLLKGHGISDIAVTLGYRPDAIADSYGDGGELGLRLRYFIERTPLGTAGGVRQAVEFLDETFVVLSGDGVTDLDITRAAAFHREKGALATLVLKRAENPMDYGVVDVDPDGRVRRFHEKPDWSEVTGDTVNTGIYILEPEMLKEIPEGRPCDFGSELFPRLVAEGRPVYGYVTSDYWCDVGDVRAYLGAHIDAMEGRVRLPDWTPGGRAVQRPGAVVDRSAVLEGPCLIDSGARVCAGAYVGPYSVIAEGCVVGEQASVKRSILWPGARLEARAQARGCVLGRGAVLGEGAQAYEESVLGTGAGVGPRGVLLPGVKLWPGKRVQEGERLDANRVWGGERAPGFIAGTLGAADPAQVARAAQAGAAAMTPREIVLGRTGSERAEALWHAAASGIMAQGVQVIDAGTVTLPMLRHAQRAIRADAALLVDDEELTPLEARGARLTGRLQRAVALLNARQDYAACAAGRLEVPLRAESAGRAYIADVAKAFAARPEDAPPVALICENPLLRDIAQQTMDRAGLRARTLKDADGLKAAPEALGLILSASGERCLPADARGALSEAGQQLLAAWVCLERGERRLILPASATRGVEALAVRYGARVEYVPGGVARWMDALARLQPGQLEIQFDGLRLGMAALSLLAERGMTLEGWRQTVPEVHRASRMVPVPARENGRVLRRLAESRPGATLEGGVRFERDGGWAWIGADERHPRLRVVAEGLSAEFADELCAFCEGEIRRLCNEGRNRAQ